MKTSKLQDNLQKYLMPIAMKVENQRHIQAIKDGMLSTMPIIIIGSFCLLPLAIKNLISSGPIFDFIIQNLGIFLFPTNFTTNIISLYTAFFIANALALKYENLHAPMVGMIAVLVQLLLCGTISEDGGISTAYLGAEGIFTAMIVAVFTVEVTNFMKKHKLTIRLPEQVPAMVAQSFSNLLPAVVLVILAMTISTICTTISGNIFPAFIMSILAPAVSSMDSLLAVMIIIFLTQLLWFFGLHGPAITSAVWGPFATAYATENMAALAAGQEVTHIFTQAFYYNLLQLGGSGLTIGLVLLMMRSKAKTLSSIGKVSLVPSIFGINEPVIFGAPIILNPFMMIPFIFGPVLMSVICYLAMDWGIVGMPIVQPPGFMPPGVGAFLMTLDWKCVVLAFVILILMAIIYYPFFKMMEADELKKEAENEKTESSQTN